MNSNLDKVSAKILVLGDSGVGKSSLIHLICHSTILNSAQWTIGCSIDVKLYENYFLEFWDIGGSRSHKIARSFLYQDYHGIILVFDATNNKSRLNLDGWLTEVTQNKNDKDLNTLLNVNFPIITIATKKDLLSHDSILDISGSGGGFGGSSSRSSSSTGYNEENCSVVNMSLDENLIPSNSYQSYSSNSPPLENSNYAIYRRHQTSDPSYTISQFHSTNFQTYSHNLSDPQTNSSFTNQSYSANNEPLLKNEVIYVNTQDVLSFDIGSKNCEKLNNFYKQVIDRRNKKFYNLLSN